MKHTIKIFPLLLTIFLLLAVPITVFAQPSTQTGGRNFSGDQLIVGDNYVLQSGDTLNGDLVVLGGNADIHTDAQVNGDIALLGGNLNLAGDVNGMVAALGANVNLTKGAFIDGELFSLGGNITGSENATIRGGIQTITPRAFMFDRDTFSLPDNGPLGPYTGNLTGGWFLKLLGNVMQILAVAVLAVLVALLLPKPTKNVADTIADQPWMSGGAGLLTILVTPFVLIVLTITIILIPLTILAALALAVAALFGWIALGYELGKRMAVLFKTEWADAVSAGLGTLVLGIVIGLLGIIPCLGAVIQFLTACAALGGVVLSVFGTRPSITKKTALAPVVEVIPHPSPAPETTQGSEPPTDNSNE